MTSTLEQIRPLLRQNSQGLLNKPNVVATGIGYKTVAGESTHELCVVCSVVQKLSPAKLSSDESVPADINGVPTDVVPSGKFVALKNPVGRFRPAPGGVSIGHVNITAGTLGCIVKRNGEAMLLSNNHVLANSNNANIGDPILQPGPVDGGQLSTDRIASLADFVPIMFADSNSKCAIAQGFVKIMNYGIAATGSSVRLQAISSSYSDNLVDAAIARPFNDIDVDNTILEIGNITGLGEGELGLALQKFGRTTGFTTGNILQVDVTVNVEYSAGRIARFSDQLLTSPMSQGGDSGSAVLDNNKRLVGLLFAGSETTTIINRIQHVFNSLDLSL